MKPETRNRLVTAGDAAGGVVSGVMYSLFARLFDGPDLRRLEIACAITGGMGGALYLSQKFRSAVTKLPNTFRARAFLAGGATGIALTFAGAAVMDGNKDDTPARPAAPLRAPGPARD